MADGEKTLGEVWMASPTTDGVTPPITKYGEVLGGTVWHGGCKGGVPALTSDGREFDLIVSLYPWERYHIHVSKTARLEIPFLDLDELDLDLVRQATSLIATYLQRGGDVLIHCQEGKNRSSFVLAALLIEHVGLSPEEAIRRIRERRSPNCLYNGTFVRQLLRLK